MRSTSSRESTAKLARCACRRRQVRASRGRRTWRAPRCRSGRSGRPASGCRRGGSRSACADPGFGGLDAERAIERERGVPCRAPRDRSGSGRVVHCEPPRRCERVCMLLRLLTNRSLRGAASRAGAKRRAARSRPGPLRARSCARCRPPRAPRRARPKPESAPRPPRDGFPAATGAGPRGRGKSNAPSTRSLPRSRTAPERRRHGDRFGIAAVGQVNEYFAEVEAVLRHRDRIRACRHGFLDEIYRVRLASVGVSPVKRATSRARWAWSQ